MTTSKQLAANRANALLSTGPRTPEGKAKASINSITHGLCSASHALHISENPSDFQLFYEGVFDSLAPQSPLDHVHAERIIGTLWRLRRVAGIESMLLDWNSRDAEYSYAYHMLTAFRRGTNALDIRNLNRHEAHLHRMLMSDLAAYNASRKSSLNLKVNVNLTSATNDDAPLETPTETSSSDS